MYMPSGFIKLAYSQRFAILTQAKKISDSLCHFADELQGGIDPENAARIDSKSEMALEHINELIGLCTATAAEIKFLQIKIEQLLSRKEV
jgi:hypothetical protein